MYLRWIEGFRRHCIKAFSYGSGRRRNSLERGPERRARPKTQHKGKRAPARLSPHSSAIAAGDYRRGAASFPVLKDLGSGTKRPTLRVDDPRKAPATPASFVSHPLYVPSASNEQRGSRVVSRICVSELGETQARLSERRGRHRDAARLRLTCTASFERKLSNGDRLCQRRPARQRRLRRGQLLQL